MTYFALPEDLQLLTPADIHEIHDEQIALYGGTPGFNDQKIVGVEATLGRVENHINYMPDTDLLRAAAVLWHGLTTAHAFLDGNKRTALMSMFAFLAVNGVAYEASGEDSAIFVEGLFELGRPIEVSDFEAHLRENTCALELAPTADPEDDRPTI